MKNCQFSKVSTEEPISFDEPNFISGIRSTCDQEIYALEDQLNHLKKQKRGLMQKLLTGEWRVKIEEKNN